MSSNHRPPTGGSAFPRSGSYPDTSNVHLDDLNEATSTITTPKEGMTLRDYFAAKILAALVAHYGIPGSEFSNDARDRRALEVASTAYSYADAMLQRRHEETRLTEQPPTPTTDEE